MEFDTLLVHLKQDLNELVIERNGLYVHSGNCVNTKAARSQEDSLSVWRATETGKKKVYTIYIKKGQDKEGN